MPHITDVATREDSGEVRLTDLRLYDCTASSNSECFSAVHSYTPSSLSSNFTPRLLRFMNNRMNPNTLSVRSMDGEHVSASREDGGGGRKTSNRSAENVAAGSSARADSIKKDVAFPHNFDILRSEGSSACGEETRLEGGQMSLSFHTTTGNTVYFTARSNGGLGENEPTDTATVPETRLQVPEDYRSSEAEGGPLVAQRIHLVTPSCVAQPRPSSMLLEVKWPVKKGVELATHFLGGPSTGRGRAPVGSIGVKPGQMLNRYVVEAQARADEPTRFPAFHKVSAKKITLEFYHDLHAMERVKTSCQSLGSSDNVCRMEDSVDRIAGFPPFLVFERGNCTLEGCICRLGRATLDTVGVCSDILSALDDLHRRGIVHGKLMPSNIEWFESKKGGTWKITGMRCPVHTGDFEQRFLRSGYAAPEVVQTVEAGRGSADVGPESDMWSFGLIAYECFTGRKLCEELSQAHGSMDAVSDGAIAERIEQVEGDTARDLLQPLLRLDASTRPTARMALRHTFQQPMPPAHSALSEEARHLLYRILDVSERNLQQSQSSVLRSSISVEYFKTRADAHYPFYLRRGRTTFIDTDSYLQDEPIFVLRATDTCRIRIAVTGERGLPLPIREIISVRVRLPDSESVSLTMQKTGSTETEHGVVALLEPSQFESRSIVAPSPWCGAVDVKYLKLEIIVRIVMEGDGAQELEYIPWIYCKIVKKGSRMWTYRLRDRMTQCWAHLPEMVRGGAKCSIAIIQTVAT